MISRCSFRPILSRCPEPQIPVLITRSRPVRFRCAAENLDVPIGQARAAADGGVSCFDIREAGGVATCLTILSGVPVVLNGDILNVAAKPWCVFRVMHKIATAKILALTSPAACLSIPEI